MTTPRKVEAKQPPVLFEQTQEILAQIEKITQTRTLAYWNSTRGSVCNNDVLAMYEMIKAMGKSQTLSIFIKSAGGNVEASLRMVHLIREFFPAVIALVPLECASASTMLALGADEIHMGPLAHLTAIDSSLTHDLSPVNQIENHKVSVSQDELLRIVNLWTKHAKEHHGNPFTDIFQYIHPLVVGAIDRSSSLSIKLCKQILTYHIKDETVCEAISRHLNSEYPSHSYPITEREARNLGLKISKLDPRLNDLLLKLNALYSEMAQKALTDYDEFNYHDNEILNVLETVGLQIYYQNDKDWNYLKEERRWQSLNDDSSWRKIELVAGKKRQSIFHIR